MQMQMWKYQLKMGKIRKHNISRRRCYVDRHSRYFVSLLKNLLGTSIIFTWFSQDLKPVRFDRSNRKKKTKNSRCFRWISYFSADFSFSGGSQFFHRTFSIFFRWFQQKISLWRCCWLSRWNSFKNCNFLKVNYVSFWY